MSNNGAANQARTGAEQAAKAAKDFVDDAADRIETGAARATRAARSFVDDATDRASDAYATARDWAGAVEPFVKDRPYASLGLAVLAGVLIGVLFIGRGPKVIYVKPRE